jgi:hypothetical protein
MPALQIALDHFSKLANNSINKIKRCVQLQGLDTAFIGIGLPMPEQRFDGVLRTSADKSLTETSPQRHRQADA